MPLFARRVETRSIEPLIKNQVRAEEVLRTEPIVQPRKPRFEPKAILFEACARGDITEVRHVLAKARLPINTPNATGSTPLHIAVAKSQLPMAEFLIDCGADINAQDDTGMSPLMLAIAQDHRKLARLLLEYGADLELPTSDGHTSLDMLVSDQMCSLVEKCLQGKYHGRDVLALYNFDPNRDLRPDEVCGDELQIKRNDHLTVLNRRDPHWWFVQNDYGQRGYVPMTHIQ